jgi:hypothetical protein
VQAENGALFHTPADIDEFRVEGDEFVLRFEHRGEVREAAHRCDNSATMWSIRTESGIRITVLNQEPMTLAFPHGEARLPPGRAFVVQRGELVLVTVAPDGTDTRNVYGYDLSGRQLWRIGEVEASVRVGPYVVASFDPSGAAVAMNTMAFKATVNPVTGAILRIRRGPW